MLRGIRWSTISSNEGRQLVGSDLISVVIWGVAPMKGQNHASDSDIYHNTLV